jgi:hypothetical protein
MQCPALDEQARAVVLGVIDAARNEWVRGTASLSTETLDELSDEADEDEGPGLGVELDPAAENAEEGMPKP